MADPRSEWPIRIGDRRFELEPAAAAFGPISIIRQHSLDNEESNERSFHNPGVWRRYRDSWHQGSDQEWLDDGRDPNEERFNKSRHVWVGEDRSIQLSEDHVNNGIYTSTERQFLVVGGLSSGTSQLFWIFDNDCRRKTNPEADWIFSDIGGPAPVTSAVYVNGKILTAHGEGQRVREMDLSAPDSWSQFGNDSTVIPEFLAYCGGRLIGGDGPNLYEIDVNGDRKGTANIMTHLNTSHDWMGAVSAPIGIFAWGDNETQGEIWYCQIDDTDGSLKHPVLVAEMPVGEWVTAMDTIGSLVLLGTNHGVRLAIMNTQGEIQYGKIVAETDYPIWDFDMQGQYAWFPVVNFAGLGDGLPESLAVAQSGDGTNEYGIAVADLGQFVDGQELVPAVWSDLTEETDGFTVVVESILTWNDRRWFTGRDANRCTVFSEHPNVYSTNLGWLTTGKITFGTPEHKRFLRLKMAWDPLPLGAAVWAFVRKDPGDEWQAVIENHSEGSRGALANIDPDIIGPHCEILFVLERAASTTETPVIRSWFLEAIPLPFKTREFVLPLQISEAVQAAYGSNKTYLDPTEEIRYLMALEDTREPVRFEMGALNYTAVVDEVRVDQTREVTRSHRWSEDREVLTGAVYVRLTTIDDREGEDVGIT